MPVHWVDVTIPMHPNMTVWPGDPPFAFHPSRRIASGDSCNVSTLTCGTHIGTHIDAPWHFEDSGPRLDAVDASIFFGPATVISLPDLKIITANDLPVAPLPPRVLFKTRNSHFPVDGPFRTDYTALSPCAAQRLADDSVRLVGVDYLSVAPYKQVGQDTHHILLRRNILVVEGLLLDRVKPGECLFTALPLVLRGADGAPCRAFVGWEERNA